VCVLVVSPNGKRIPENYVKNAWSGNDDGYGIVALSDEHEALVFRGMSGPEAAILDMEAASEIGPYVMHFRFATQGDITLDQTHPYEIPQVGRPAIYVAHNGILPYPYSRTWTDPFEEKNKGDDSKSDTMLFAERLAKEYATNLEDALNLRRFRNMLKRHVGSINRLAFARPESRRISIINMSEGVWKDGIWYSNTSAFSNPVPRWTPSNQWYTNMGVLATRLANTHSAEESAKVLCGTSNASSFVEWAQEHYYENMESKCDCQLCIELRAEDDAVLRSLEASAAARSKELSRPMEIVVPTWGNGERC
jgi:hypothetical protein